MTAIEFPKLAPQPLQARPSTNWNDFEFIELDYPFDPRIAKFVGAPRGAHREPQIAIRRKPAQA